VIFVSAKYEVYMIQLKSLQFKLLFKSNIITNYLPFTSFYTTGDTSFLCSLVAFLLLFGCCKIIDVPKIN
jgi:hypothetical protein